MLILSPSILAADFSILGQQLREIEEAGAAYIHIDIMDGVFVPQISFGMPVVSSIRKVTDRVFDVHLMVENPESKIESFVECGADSITFHLEAVKDAGKTIDQIHNLGVRAGISIKPATSVEQVFPYLEEADMVLVMSVEPGYGGQTFIPETFQRIRTIRSYLEEKGLEMDIQVDGGVHPGNAGEIIEAGANVLVAGSAIFNGSITENIRYYQEIFNTYEIRKK